MKSTKLKKRNKIVKDTKLFYMYISPWLFGLIAFTLFPMVISLVFSFTNVKIANATQAKLNFVGFKNYIDILRFDKDFIRSIRNTFTYATIKVAFILILGLLIALLLNSKIAGKKIFRTMIYLPAIIPVVSVALLWKLIFTGNEMNIANFFLSYLGIAPVNFFGTATSSMATVIFIGIWGGLGPVMLILIAALQGVSKEMIEASELDGAGVFSKFFYIILPTISSSLFFVGLTNMIGSIQAYAEIKLLTNGGPGISTITMNMIIVQNAFNNLGKKTLGYASAQGWIVFLISLVFTIIFLKTVNKKVYYEEGA